MTCFLMSGCGRAAPPIDGRALPCPRPAAPVMRKLDRGQPVCSWINEKRKAGNVSALVAYARSLEATVDCYEGQVAEPRRR